MTRKTKQPAPPVLPRLHRLFQKKWKKHYSIALEVQDLIEGRAADPNDRDEDGNTALHACMYGHSDAVPVLIKYRAEVDARNNAGKTPLQVASANGITDAVEALLDAGADPDVRDEFGDTLLHIACHNGRTDTVRFLLEHGADVNARNDGGETSIHRACGGWNIEDTLFQVLLDAGAEMDVRDNYDDTPLHHACGHGRPHAVRFLLDAGADPNAKDKGGRIPLDLTERVAEAREEVKREIIDLFREHAPEQVMEAYCTNKEATHGR